MCVFVCVFECQKAGRGDVLQAGSEANAVCLVCVESTWTRKDDSKEVITVVVVVVVVVVVAVVVVVLVVVIVVVVVGRKRERS